MNFLVQMAFLPNGPNPQQVPATTANATALNRKRVGATIESSQSLLEVSSVNFLVHSGFT